MDHRDASVWLAWVEHVRRSDTRIALDTFRDAVCALTVAQPGVRPMLALCLGTGYRQPMRGDLASPEVCGS